MSTLLVYIRGTPTWRLYTCEKYFDEYLRFRKTQRLKLGEVSSLAFSHKIKLPWLYPLNNFRIIFLLRGSASQEYSLAMFPTKVLVTRKQQFFSSFRGSTQLPLDPPQKNYYHELLLKIEKQHSMHAEAMMFLFAGICKIWAYLQGVFKHGISIHSSTVWEQFS